MNNYRAHQNEVVLLKRELTKEFPNGRLRDSHTGVFYRKPDFNKIMSILTNGSLGPVQKFSKIKSCLIPIKINKAGFPDNYFTISVKGFPIIIYIETKTGKGKQTPDQIDFENQCNMTGMIYLVNRDHKETVNNVKKILNDINQRIKG